MSMPIQDIFQAGFAKGASDVHIAVDSHPLLRINGELIELTDYPVLTQAMAEELCFSLLSDAQRNEFMQERELDFSYELADSCRFRVNLHWERDHVGLVARIVSSRIPTIQELYFPSVVYDLLRLRQGLILVTGPTGSGKSTSLAAMIDLINTERKEHIVTLEDPIEFLHKSKHSLIRQRQLHTDFLSFPEALKHVVRQDPNVIMVGEMRDLETIAAAITVAETGHLVLATLHTLNAAQTIDRIVDIFPPYQQDQVRVQLSLELRGIISQQLIPRVHGGRVAAREILINTPAIANLIRENKVAQMKTVLQTSADQGMQTLDQDIRSLYEKGEISREVAYSYMANPSTLLTTPRPQQ